MLNITPEECLFLRQAVEQTQVLGKDAHKVSKILLKVEKEFKKLYDKQTEKNGEKIDVNDMAEITNNSG